MPSPKGRLTRREFLCAAVAAGAMGALAACAPKPGGGEAKPTAAPAQGEPQPAEKQHNISFAWWMGGEGANKVFEEAVDRFELSHPNFKVNRMPTDFGEFQTKLLTMYGAGNAPDCHGVPGGTVWSWAEKGVLLDLTPLVDRDANEVKWDDMQPAVTGELYYPAKHITALPRETCGLQMMIYNKTLFEQAGVDTPDKDYEAGRWTWELWAERAKALTKFGADGRRETMGVYCWGVGLWALQQVMPAYGVPEFNPELTHFNLDDPKVVKWLNMVRKMYVDDRSLGKSDEYGQFDWGGTGKLGMEWGATWGLPNYRLTWAKLDWDFAPAPKGDCCHTNIVGNDFHVVNGQKTADQEGGWELIKFFNSPREDLWWASNMFGPPFRKSNLDTWVAKAKETLPKNGWKYIPDMTKQALPFTAAPFFNDVDTVIGNEIGQALNGDRPVDEVVKSIVTKADAEMAKHKKA